MITVRTHQPVYILVTGQGLAKHSDELATEDEAEARASALRAQDPARYRDLEIEKRLQMEERRLSFLKRDGEWQLMEDVRAGRTRAARDRDIAEAKATRPPGPHTFIGTFTRENYHPNTGQNLRFAHVEFQAATGSDANALMWDAFGEGGWWDAHEIEEVRDKLGVSPDFRVSWPTPTSPNGETVTLRVRITPELAQENAIWLAGRCLVHRPAPNCAVQPGAGVWPENDEYPDDWSPQGLPGVLCVGLVLLVKFVNRADAERAVARDPENIAIVPESESLGTFRWPPRKGPENVSISGTLSFEALEALASADARFKAVYNAAVDEWERTGAADKAAHAVEVENGRIVAVHVQAKSRVWG